MRSSFQSVSLLPGTALALAGLALLIAPHPVSAQTLTLGTFPGVTPATSGAATISAAGTVATGTFKFSTTAGPTTSTYRGASAYTGSTLTLNAGAAVTVILSGHDQSVININGGTVNQLQSFDSNATNIFGGSVFYASALGNINGGASTGLVNLYGGSLTYLATQQGGIVDVFGTGLTETFLGTSGDPSLGPIFSDYALAGTLQDGTALSATYSTTVGSLLFNGKAAVPSVPAVPEASTTVSLGLLLMLGMGGLVVAARKKRRA